MPLLQVEQFGPAFHVKIQGRQGSTVVSSELDQDVIAITTSRQLNSPAGAWALTLVSRRDRGGRTWAQRIRPMDYVEIRFGRYDINTRNHGNNNRGLDDLPIVMRGFVDRVTETVRMDQNQQPFRQTTILGKDMGKLLLIRQLYLLPTSQQSLLAAAAHQKQGDLGAFTDLWGKLKETASGDPWISPEEFLKRIKNLIYNDTDQQNSFGGRSGGSGQTQVEGVPDLKFVTKDMDSLYVSPGNIQNFQGPVWNLISSLQGAPICELFVHDTKEGPELVWRRTPYKDKKGKIIEPVSLPGQSTQLSLAEIMEYTVSTSDSNVFTYYYVYPQQSQFMGGPYRLWAMTPNGDGSEGQNPIVRRELARRYGFKPYEVQFPLMRDLPNALTKDINDLKTEWQRQGEKLAGWMDKAYSHSVNLEEGTMTIRGNEKLDIGAYIKFRETREEFYIDSIRHDFILNPPRFTTTLNVSRGLWSDPSPYPDDAGDAGSGEQGGHFVDPGTGKGLDEITDRGTLPTNVA